MISGCSNQDKYISQTACMCPVQQNFKLGRSRSRSRSRGIYFSNASERKTNNQVTNLADSSLDVEVICACKGQTRVYRLHHSTAEVWKDQKISVRH